MNFLLIKIVASALLIAAVSEIAKRNTGFAALVASLPMLSILAVIWMYAEGVDNSKIANHLEATFWYVLPSLPLFLLIPILLRNGLSFFISLAIGIIVTAVLYLFTQKIAALFGITL